jgi:hypothetical protein
MLTALFLAGPQSQRAVFDLHARVARYNVDVIGRNARPILGLAHRQRSDFCQQLGQDALMPRVEMRDQHDGHAGVDRQTLEQLPERFEAAG